MAPHGKHPRTLVRSERPFNAGPPAELLRASSVTPTELFFVRNHGDVPEVGRAEFRLRVEGEVERPLELALDELGRRPRRELVATIQCAGNRREELAAHRPIPNELPWGTEAISTARWSGVALADVLAEARPTARARHVEMIGLDWTERHGERFRYGASIPLEKALASETLLATGMNGEALAPTHGAPLRAVVPGWIGARSVKWLDTLRLRETPSENYFQSVAYRLFPASVGPDNVVWDEGAMLGEQAVQAIITAPAPSERVEAGRVRVEGVAYVGGPRTIERVEVSGDDGASWIRARLGESLGPWAWRLWEAEVELAPGRRRIAARAWDSAGQTQPSEIAQVWNFKGYMNNAWHRLEIEAV
ncbi:MAG TPA: sulfite oxidase [Thermoanaerobaculia bacterium]|nr:sulfite oxidase [Thermoanaerobaculia bacterium]